VVGRTATARTEVLVVEVKGPARVVQPWTGLGHSPK